MRYSPAKLSSESQDRMCVKMNIQLPEKGKNNKQKQNISYNSLNKISRNKITINHCYADRFGVPITMMNKEIEQRRKKNIETRILKKIRLTQMGYNQPPLRDHSSDNDSIQNVKRLAIDRTPFFLISTIKIANIRQKDKLPNKYLQYGLNRINVLLNDNQKLDNKLDEHRNTTSDFQKKMEVSLGSSKPRGEVTVIYSHLRSKPRETQHSNGFQVNMNFCLM